MSTDFLTKFFTKGFFMNRGIKGYLAAFVGAASTLSADTLSAAYDTKAGDSFGFLVQVAAFAFDASNKVALKLTHCDTIGGTYEDCAAIDYEGGVIKELTDAADGNKVHAVGYVGSKRFVKLSLDVTGTVSVAQQYMAISTAPLAMPAI